MIPLAVHIFFILVLGLSLQSTPVKEVKPLDRAKVLSGYYKGCTGPIIKETDIGVWIKVTDCRHQTGKRFFVHNFIRRLK